MTISDINALYTEAVSACIAEGFQINVTTMSNSCCDIVHVDLRRGDEVRRVYMDSIGSYGESYDDYLVIRVGQITAPVKKRWRENYIRNEQFEVISEIKLAKLSDSYYVSQVEGVAAKRKRAERQRRRNEGVIA